MKRRLIIALALVLVLALLTSAALAGYPDPLWKNECPPWATVQITAGLNGWVGVECYAFDAAGPRVEE